MRTGIMGTPSNSGNYRNESSFWQFSDQLRQQTNALSSISIEDSIWSDSNITSDRNGRASGWNSAFGGLHKIAFGTSNYGVSRYNNTEGGSKGGDAGGVKNFGSHYNDGGNGIIKDYFNSLAVDNGVSGGGEKGATNNSDSRRSGKKKKNSNSTNAYSHENKEAVLDKKFKTLPPSESLPRNEAIGGYIFVCNNDTMEENLRRQLFGLPSRFKDSVRAIKPGLPLFLYNYSTHQLHGIFESATFGGTNIDPTAWADKKCPGESRFPAQVRVVTRKLYEPIKEDAFRPILHHYDGPKFRLELNVEDALRLLDIFSEQNS